MEKVEKLLKKLSQGKYPTKKEMSELSVYELASFYHDALWIRFEMAFDKKLQKILIRKLN